MGQSVFRYREAKPHKDAPWQIGELIALMFSLVCGVYAGGIAFAHGPEGEYFKSLILAVVVGLITTTIVQAGLGRAIAYRE